MPVAQETIPQIEPAQEFRQRRPAARARLPMPLNLLLVYLAGITIFGKGPAYIGIGNIYWGEVVLAVSLLWAFTKWGQISVRSLNSWVLSLLICAFVVMGAIETARDFPAWGILALRDAALWYYSAFYFVGLVIATRSEESRLFRARWKLFFILSIPWAVEEVFMNPGFRGINANSLSQLLAPALPGYDVSVLSSEGLEIVQSMGLGCLLLLSDRRTAAKLGTVARVCLAMLGLAMVAVYYGRGAKLAVLAAFLVSGSVNVTQGSLGRYFRKKFSLAIFLLAVGAIGAVAAGTNLIDKLSLDRFEGASLDNPEDTAEWRATWWAHLYDGVMERGPAFGIGFGENLSDYNPYINDQNNGGDTPLRSPHNINMTVFSRMGITGSVIWAGILLAGLGVPIVRLMRKSDSWGRDEAIDHGFWVAAAVAMWVNSSFGVLMEGPVVGIPFWLILGLLSGQANRLSRRSTTIQVTSSVSRREWPQRLAPVRS
jgi:hypothetical protein